ncbi:hypothetical protein [Nocardioides sp. T2.26MG-1]|uniref:hypothetical protein n=1 Tax=Nocardioides sp. T2.26MG-1 TaxID=3041166 RepID=UPI002477C85D|nr:hypothetical protein [Nocardioides sp. T2.26MG-1]CAI9409235.1 hypothetical protein HIDPHFAB_01246 [Nocardioides sp. T2.26MG-1]
MNRPAAHPLWWAAPTRLARTPGWLLLVVVATTLLVASVAAPPLFVATARTSALDTGLRAAAGSPFGPGSADLRVVWDAFLPPRDLQTVLDRLDALPAYGEPDLGASGFGQSRMRRAYAVAGDRRSPASMFFHEGAIERLGGDPDAEGVWLSETTAAELGVEPGDRVSLAMIDTFFDGRPTLARTTLLGTYPTPPGSVLPTVLADLPASDRWLVPFQPDSPGVGAPLAIVSLPTLQKMSMRIFETVVFTADLVLDHDLTPAQATAAARGVEAVGRESVDLATDLGSALRSGEPDPARLDIATGLPGIVAGAETTADTARVQVRPYAVGGQLLAALLLAAAWVLLGLSRRREQLLSSGLGLRPWELALLGALEVVPVCLVAVPAGLGLGVAGVLTAGPPSGVGVDVGGADLVGAAAASAVGLVLVAAVAGATGLAADRQARLSRLGGRRITVPWGSAVLVATVVLGIAVLTLEPQERSRTPLAIVLPLLVATTVAILVTRAAALLAGRWRLRSRAGSARWLAARRSGTVLREVSALAAVVAVALGMFAYTLAVQRGIDDGVADKTAALAGASSSMEVAEDFRGQGRRVAVTAPAPGTSVVWRHGVVVPPRFGDQPLLAIDPETFADVADWGASGELDAGRALVPRLAEEAEGVPVIIAGETELEPGDQAALDFNSEGVQVPIQVVGVVDAFPGSESQPNDYTVVISSRRIFPLVPQTIDPRRKGATSGEAGAFTSWVWSDGSSAELRDTLRAAHVAGDGELVTADGRRVANGLVASTWAAAYVAALGGVVLVLGFAAALVLALRLADRDAVSDVLLRRVGFSNGELARSRAWEIGRAVGVALVAAGLSVAVLVAAPTMIDATTSIAPLARPRPGVRDAVTLAAVLVAIVLVAWLVGARRAARRRTAEVLRAGG